MEELEKIVVRIVKRTLAMLTRRALLAAEELDGLAAFVDGSRRGQGARARPPPWHRPAYWIRPVVVMETGLVPVAWAAPTLASAPVLALML